MRSPAGAGIRFVLPLFLSVALGHSTVAQTGVPAATPLPTRPVPPSVDLDRLSPFALNGGPGFRILAADKISEQDRELLAQSEASLRRAALLQNVGFDSGDWKHVQLDCPSFPNHLLVRFERANGSRDVSIFSVVIARGGAGTVRVLPILRRSYSTFWPASRNPLTIAIFNRLLREEKTAAKPGWVSLASCYAAFSGQAPEIGDAGVTWSVAPDPILHLYPDGGASIRMETTEPNAQAWVMEFARDGRLLSASSTAQETLHFQQLPDWPKPMERPAVQDSPEAEKNPR